jgi:hypothetical protein
MSFQIATSKSSLIFYLITFIVGHVHVRVWFEPSILLFYKILISLFCFALVCLLSLADDVTRSLELEVEKELLARG